MVRKNREICKEIVDGYYEEDADISAEVEICYKQRNKELDVHTHMKERWLAGDDIPRYEKLDKMERIC